MCVTGVTNVVASFPEAYPSLIFNTVCTPPVVLCTIHITTSIFGLTLVGGEWEGGGNDAAVPSPPQSAVSQPNMEGSVPASEAGSNRAVTKPQRS